MMCTNELTPEAMVRILEVVAAAVYSHREESAPASFVKLDDADCPSFNARGKTGYG